MGYNLPVPEIRFYLGLVFRITKCRANHNIWVLLSCKIHAFIYRGYQALGGVRTPPKARWEGSWGPLCLYTCDSLPGGIVVQKWEDIYSELENKKYGC